MIGEIFQRSKVQLYIKGGIRHSHVVTLENFKFYTNKGVYVCLTDGGFEFTVYIHSATYTVHSCRNYGKYINPDHKTIIQNKSYFLAERFTADAISAPVCVPLMKLLKSCTNLPISQLSKTGPPISRLIQQLSLP
jgi:hypothetical protein